MEYLKAKVRTVPDFPKPGIMFRDITTLLKDAQGLHDTIEHLAQRYESQNIDVIAGIESRGFILASALAVRLNKGLILIRKPGKLPAETVGLDYELEYGTDRLEIHTDAISSGERVLMIDDLIATGGTMKAGCQLVKNVGGVIVECVFVIELPDLGGRQILKDYPVYSVMEFEGD